MSIKKEMLSPGTPMGGSCGNMLEAAVADPPEYPENGSSKDFERWSKESGAYYKKRAAWSEHMTSGGKTFDFSGRGVDHGMAQPYGPCCDDED